MNRNSEIRPGNSVSTPPWKASDDVGAALERFGVLLRTPLELPGLLQAVSAQIVATILSADMAGVTILSTVSRQPETVACTDERALNVDIDQYQADEGPCLEASRTQQIVRIRIADAAQRWPDFAKNVAGMGVSSYLSAPLTTDDNHVGALNLYSYSDHGFTEIDEVLLQVFVAAIEGVVWKARREEQWRREVDGLRDAMKARAKIEQAKGMLMMLRGIDATAAFEVLVAQSQRKNTRLAVVASELIESVADRGGIETCTPTEYSTYSAAVVGFTRRAVAGQQWPPFGVHSHG